MLVPEGVDLALHTGQAFGEGLAVAPRLHTAAHRPQLPPHGHQAGECRQDAGDGGENRGYVLHLLGAPLAALGRRRGRGRRRQLGDVRGGGRTRVDLFVADGL